MVGVPNKSTSHITWVFDLTYFSMSQTSQWSKQITKLAGFVTIFDLECSNLVWTCFCWAPSTFSPNFGPIELQIWPPGCHLGKSTNSYSWTNDHIFSKFLSYILIVGIWENTGSHSVCPSVCRCVCVSVRLCVCPSVHPQFHFQKTCDLISAGWNIFKTSKIYLSSCKEEPYCFWCHRVKVTRGTTWKHKLLSFWPNPRQFFIMKTSNEDTLHITWVFDLTYFSKSHRSNFNNFYDVLKLLSYWADRHQIFIMDSSNIHL
jgi:hypothetical protein